MLQQILTSWTRITLLSAVFEKTWLSTENQCVIAEVFLAQLVFFFQTLLLNINIAIVRSEQLAQNTKKKKQYSLFIYLSCCFFKYSVTNLLHPNMSAVHPSLLSLEGGDMMEGLKKGQWRRGMKTSQSPGDNIRVLNPLSGPCPLLSVRSHTQVPVSLELLTRWVFTDISIQMNGSSLRARKCPVWPLPAPRSSPLLTALWACV